MQAGLLRYYITIEQQDVTTNDFGSQTVNWTKYTDTKCNIKYNSGNKVVQNSEIVNIYSITFIVRRYIQVVENMRIVYNGKKYRILSIEDDLKLNQKTIIGELINE